MWRRTREGGRIDRPQVGPSEVSEIHCASFPRIMGDFSFFSESISSVVNT